MIMYHACWDIVWIFGENWTWYNSFGAYLWQQSICWTFILLSGFCFHLGRHHFRRGNIVFWSGCLVTAVTLLFMPENRVFFGVLSLLGCAVLLTYLFQQFKIFRHIPPRLGLTLNFSLFFLMRDVVEQRLGFEGISLVQLPTLLYRNDFTACFGFPPPSFFSTDYFPLIPWLFLFWTGYFLYPLRTENKTIPSLHLSGLAVIGRHSLLIYLLHQPIIYGLLLSLYSVVF